MASRDEHLMAAMAELRSRAEHYGDPSLRDGVLTFGDTAMPPPGFPIVSGTEDAFGCAASIFAATGDGFVRATTSIHRDGVRVLRTELDPEGPVIGPLRRGEAYRGPAEILGVMTDTYYEPILDGDGAVIGAYYVGVPDEG